MAAVEQQIADWLGHFEPQSVLLRTWELTGGISSTMTAFTVERAGQSKSFILRQPSDWTLKNVPGAVRNEFTRLGILHRGGLPVQAPVFCDESGEHFGRPGLVLTYIEGKADLSPDDPRRYVDQFARLLGRIHDFDATDSALGLRHPVTSGFNQFREKTMPQAGAELQVERIWATLQAHADVTTANPVALLHGDFWPGNTLWRDGELVAVIDWEEPRLGDPLQDLSICRLDLWWALGERAMTDFTECYLALRPTNTALLPLWDLRTALRPVRNIAEWAAAYIPLGRPDVTVEHMRDVHVEFVAQAYAAMEHS
jgi:aminoglycoside phosphotransferase (APT) family kinase protein